MNITAIIPSRFGSQRLPGKPLSIIHGKTMIQWVYERTIKCKEISTVIVATDEERIFKHVESFGGRVIMTSQHHESGTDRCYEAAINEGITNPEDIILNIQGDEPFINPIQISQLCACFKNPETQIATLVKPIKEMDELFNPSKPKVILDAHKKALYFSRAAIPFLKNFEKEQWLEKGKFYKHIGIYGYRFDVLKSITALSPSVLELAEGLEQLRWLEHGFFIQTDVTDYDSVSVDTPEDLEKINKTSLDFFIT
jgi:3-deoxy-manno-octulosonate cytidylyltransferase (CMP-KDO synthetase)